VSPEVVRTLKPTAETEFGSAPVKESPTKPSDVAVVAKKYPKKIPTARIGTSDDTVVPELVIAEA
jgi:hypothetical protein